MRRYTLQLGDNRELLAKMKENTVDSIVTDPPYGLSDHSAKDVIECLLHWIAGARYEPGGGGFMGKDWDAWVPGPDVWRECYRVLKPGGHLLCFAGTRTQDLMGIALRLAGFEIRDSAAWLFGSGFPKSLDVSKAIDGVIGKQAHGFKYKGGDLPTNGGSKFRSDHPEYEPYLPATPEAAAWQGFGTALKPAHEPIIVARKPLEGTVAQNVLKWGTGAINVDGCRVEGTWERSTTTRCDIRGGRTVGGESGGIECEPQSAHVNGRWPANLVHDGSEEVLGLFPQAGGGFGKRGQRTVGEGWATRKGDANSWRGTDETVGYGDTGSAARFFYCAPQEPINLLFCRAKAIMDAWNQDLANTAENSLYLSKHHVDSVLSDAVTVATHADKLLSGWTAHSTNVTPNELRMLCETLITAILSLESGHSRGLSLGEHTPNKCLVSVAETQKPTDTTTITINLPKSDGYAASATFNITQASKVVGEADSAARFKYCAKASKQDRDEGLEGWTQRQRDDSRQQGDPGGDNPRNRGAQLRSNNHPTVKPTLLMRWLVRLVTPPGGVVLDPFAGSGSTGKAAMLEGFDFLGMELDPEYLEIARARIEFAIADQAFGLFDVPELDMAAD